MCRHAAYIGPGIALTELVTDLPHSLEHQAYAANELQRATVCADGFGVAWYDPASRAEPARYASVMPLWNDSNLRSFGPTVRSGCVMAAVRSATEAGGVVEANCAPIVHGKHAWSLNGYLDDFATAWKAWLVDRFDVAAAPVKGTTDTEWIGHAVLAATDAGLPTALQGVLRILRDEADGGRGEVQLNFLWTDGEQVIASRCGTADQQNSLYLLQDGAEFPGAHVVASEPLYDDDWQAVDDDQILVLRQDAPPVRLKI